MNRDNNTTARQQPVTTAIKRPSNKSTMTTELASAGRQAIGANKSSGANMATSGGAKKANGRSPGQQSGALMKKAYVRFDDYLDLNEENMRRSCKRLMNHLYSEPSCPGSAAGAAAAARAQSPPVEGSKPRPTPPPATGAPIKSSATNNSNGDVGCTSGARSGSIIGAKSKSANSTHISIGSKTAATQHKNQQNSNSPLTTTTTTTTTTAATSTNGKSYLRSQYERRQQRQLELMSKMQLEPGKQTANNNNNAHGANECQQPRQLQQQQQKPKQLHNHQTHRHQQQQQDLVAKSHELSKRRFFEKLERRESIRNLNLSTPPPPLPPLPTGKRTQLAAPDAETCSLADSSPKIIQHYNHTSNEQLLSTAERQKNSGEDELMLKVYQSIVLKGTDHTQSCSYGGSKDDTLEELDGTPPPLMATAARGTKELANELNGFYTLSPQLPLSDGEQAQHTQKPLIESPAQIQQEQLIQLQDNQQLDNNSSSSTLVAKTLTEVANSAFETFVPAKSNIGSNQNHPDGFISSGLLIVKQVETADANLLLEHKQHQIASTCAGTRLEKGPPTLRGRQKDGAPSSHLAANKMKTPLVDELTGNKVKQIDGQHLESRTISEPVIAGGGGGGGAKSLGSSISASSIDSDNQQNQAPGISLTISSENNHNSCYEMNKAISSSKVQRRPTTDFECNSGNTSTPKESTSSNENPRQKQQRAIENGGESDCAKDHEAPEMRMLVGQSGGAKNFTNGNLVVPDKPNFTYPLQTESTAQAQQVAEAPTTITIKPAIRDVLPGAKEINRTDAIVSGNNSCKEATDAGKVTVISAKQVNEVHSIVPQQQIDQENSESNGYANSRLDEKEENNVNHDVSEARLVTLAGGSNHMGEHNNHLIESFTATEHHPILTHKDSNSLSVEEDGGSSCSSSGFGASVSVTSSSEGSNSLADTMMVVAGNKCESGLIRRPHSLAVAPSLNSNPIYDTVQPKSWSRKQTNVPVSDTNEFPDYKKLVGPDQAYPSKSRLLLVENHNYASILNRCEQDKGDGIVLERDDSVAGYANFPLNKGNQIKALPKVEYATVRPIMSDNMSNQNKKRVNNSASVASLSGQSYSNSSANSGGFSALPPAKLELCSGNNFNSSATLNIENGGAESPKKISILKRFGSLVSRTFSTQTNVPSSTTDQNQSSKTNESESSQTEEKVRSFNGNEMKQKPALVIEQNPHQQPAAHKEQQIEEADLIILPPKHVNQRELPDEQHPTTAPKRLHHDRLSRDRKHSRKVKITDSSSLNSLSSSSTSSIGSGASPHEQTKRSESLFEDLESLVSASEQSNTYDNHESVSQSRKRAVSSDYGQRKATIEGRVDIDCISPDKFVDECKSGRQSAAPSKYSGPRSLLRIFSAISTAQRSSESTPNLASPAPTSREFSDCDQIISGQEATCDQSLQPISGFWGFSSLVMNTSHASAGVKPVEMSKASKSSRTKASAKSNGERQNCGAYKADSSFYCNLQPLTKGYQLHLSSCNEQDQQHSLDKYQSLNLYQNLLRNYTKRRNRNRHGHHHSHSHHSHHHHHRSRHSHRSVRCTTNCGQSCQSCGSCSGSSGTTHCKVSVWGQLIKINKSDGSQVIELQRSPGKPWGFFVARGAINNIKGIFISRMHDNLTSSSLTGLLSIGDRILAIDECPIEPDYDILRVNQMISKKSKILLKVKPFKG